MKKIVVAAAAALALSIASVAQALDVDGVGPGYFASDNIEYVGYVPFENDTAGARVVGKYMYITTSRGLTIYDLSDPVAPKRAGFAAFPQAPYFAQEDLDTNGKILLVDTLFPNVLNVVDVEDKSNPTVIGQLEGVTSHTQTCVLDCTYAYSSDGTIIDLRDPTKPKVVGDWSKASPGGGAHDVTEVAPGMVVTSTSPILLLDARKKPAKPKIVAVAATQEHGYMHSNLWPRQMNDKFLLVGAESGGPRCGPTSASFQTWDATKAKSKGRFTIIDEYRVKNGLYTDGDSPANLFCMHWFDEHPTFKNGGEVAVAWYEHGTRLFDISSKGKIKPTGYFLPAGGSTSAAYWVTKDIIYTADYNRGVDIIRVIRKP